MAKTPRNHTTTWTRDQVKGLKNLADQNTPTRLIAHKLHRTENAVRSKAADLDVSLKPTNQSPYTLQGKE